MVTQECQSLKKTCCLLTVSPGCGYARVSEHEEDVLFVDCVTSGCGYPRVSEPEEDVLFVDCVTGLWLPKSVRA